MGGFSQEIRFKIGGETSSIQRSFDSLPAMAERAGRKVDKVLGSFSGARGMREKLERFRADLEFKQSNTLGKIQLVTASLRGAEEARNRYAKGTTQYYQAQLDILKNQSQLRELEAQRADETKESPAKSSNLRQVIGGAVGGAIVWALGRVIANQQANIAVSQAQAESRGVGAESLSSRFAAIGGLQGQLHQGQRNEQDLERQKQFAQGRVKLLSSSAADGIVNFIAPEEFAKAQIEVERLTAEIQKQHDANALISRDLRRQTNEYLYQRNLIEDTIYFQENHGSSLTIAKVKAVASQKRLGVMEKNPGDYTWQEIKQARLESESTLHDMTMGMQQMFSHQKDVQQALTQDASGGRTFRNGAPRPLSETERLARRALRSRQAEHDAVITGQAQRAGQMQSRAMMDESSVARRLSAGSRNIVPTGAGDWTELAAKVENSNTLLTAIKDSLEDVPL